MRKFVLIFIVLMSIGCSSIPVATMLKFRDFDGQSFTELNPSQIRSKIQLSGPFTLEIEKINLSLSVENDKGLRHFKFPLALEKQQSIAAKEGIFSSQPAKSEFTFRLSELAIEQFTELQNVLLEDKIGKVSFSVAFSGGNFKEEPKEDQPATISISLQLEEKNGYFTLIKETEVDFRQDG